MGHSNIEVTPESGSFGALVSGVDFSAGLDDATLKDVRNAWLQYKVLFFRDQDLSCE